MIKSAVLKKKYTSSEKYKQHHLFLIWRKGHNKVKVVKKMKRKLQNYLTTDCTMSFKAHAKICPCKQKCTIQQQLNKGKIQP